MKRLLFCAFAAVSFLTSCSEEDPVVTNNPEVNETPANTPVSGHVYGTPFAVGGGKSRFTTMFDVESVQIQLTSQQGGCDADVQEYPIRITAPRTVGVHTSDVYVTFNDPESDGYISISGGSTVEITSITETMVTGKVLVNSSSDEGAINGTFSVPLCE